MKDELLHLRDLIHERTGLFFRDENGLETISHRLIPVLEKHQVDSITAFYQLLKETETTSPYWRDTFTALTKQASSFYRQKHHLQALAGSVLPKMFTEGDRKRFKIWSAGCSTGEEPCGIAIALDEAGWFDRAEVEIFGCDASTSAIEKARVGIYSRYRLGIDDALLDKYFLPVNEEWQIAPALRQRIQWSVANLFNENEIAGFADADIIFCRNVFIYFSDSAIVKTLSLFAKYMPAGGHLFTDCGDHFNTLVEQTGFFETREINGIPVRIRRRHVTLSL